MNKKLSGVLAAVLLGGCASSGVQNFATGEGYAPSHFKPVAPAAPKPATGGYQPLIDNPGPMVNADLGDCQKYANNEGMAGSAVTGAVVGALVGAAINAVAGGGYGAEYAGLGAASGGVGGIANAAANKRQVTINCMRGRGYNVLR